MDEVDVYEQLSLNPKIQRCALFFVSGTIIHGAHILQSRALDLVA